MNIWTMKKRSRLGFTLVELIVVIAILAILAGIAIPVYSNYIKKANEAADNMLLAAVNTAFGAASLEGGNSRPASATATLTDGAVTQVKSTVDEDGAAFAKYFAGNEGNKFKVFTNLSYNRVKGTFTGAKVTSSTVDGVTTYTYTIGGQTYTATQEQLDAISASTYGQNIGMDTLLGDIGGMVNSLTDTLGSGNTLAGLIGTDKLTEWGIKPDDEGNYNKAELANAVVLMVAENVPEGSAADITSMMSSATTLTNLTNTMKSGNIGTIINQLGNVTAFYAMATGFAASDEAKDWTTTVDGKTYNAQEYYDYINSNIAATAANTSLNTTQKASEIMNQMASLSNMMMTDGSFNALYSNYIAGGESSQLNLDAQGFEQAMHAIDANQGSLAASGALQQGFNSGDIAGILNMIFGG